MENLKKYYYDKGEEYATEVENIRDDYIATSDALYQYITDWEEKYNTLIKLQTQSKRNQKKKKEASACIYFTRFFIFDKMVSKTYSKQSSPMIKRKKSHKQNIHNPKPKKYKPETTWIESY